MESAGYAHRATRYELQCPLRFAKDPPGLLTGDRVRVHGVRLGSALALDSGTTSVQVVATAIAPNIFGEQHTLLILVNFQDNTSQPYSPAQAYSTAFGVTPSRRAISRVAMPWSFRRSTRCSRECDTRRRSKG